MELNKAKQIALQQIRILRPFCLEIYIAGSIRREKPEVKDIELVAVPLKTWSLESHFKNSNYYLNKNGTKYKQYVTEGINVDLFICNRDNFGLIYLIRTGSADFSKRMLARWKQVSGGGYSKDGYLHNRYELKIATFTEQEVFKCLEMDFIEPKDRI